MTGAAQVLSLEGALGMTTGHEATVAYIENAIAHLEGGTDDSS
jgi:hypothetical protein